MTVMTKLSTRGPVFPVYLELEVGGESRDEFMAEISDLRIYASDWAKDVVSKLVLNPSPKKRVKFARVKVRDLGFTKNPTTAQIWARIRKFGHTLCEPSDGLAIRVALNGQPKDDVFWLAMKNIAGSDGDQCVFEIRQIGDSERWLCTRWMGLPGGFVLGHEIVFRL